MREQHCTNPISNVLTLVVFSSPLPSRLLQQHVTHRPRSHHTEPRHCNVTSGQAGCCGVRTDGGDRGCCRWQTCQQMPQRSATAVTTAAAAATLAPGSRLQAPQLASCASQLSHKTKIQHWRPGRGWRGEGWVGVRGGTLGVLILSVVRKTDSLPLSLTLTHTYNHSLFLLTLWVAMVLGGRCQRPGAKPLGADVAAWQSRGRERAAWCHPAVRTSQQQHQSQAGQTEKTQSRKANSTVTIGFQLSSPTTCGTW